MKHCFMLGPFRSAPRSLNEGVEVSVAGDMLAVPAPTTASARFSATGTDRQTCRMVSLSVSP